MKTYVAIIEYMGMLDVQPIFLSSISSLKPITFVPLIVKSLIVEKTTIELLVV